MVPVMATSLDALKSITWNDVCMATTGDGMISTPLVSLIEDGFPESRREMPQALQDYFHLENSLYTLDGVVLYNDCIVIPPSL